MAGATGWFQAHPLARAFLRIELETNGGKDVSDLHHRAACWFAGEGRWSSAVEHALLDPHDTCLLVLVGQVGLEPLLRSTPKGQRFAAAVVRTAPARWPLGRPLALAGAVLANVDSQAAYGVSEPLRRTTFRDAADERFRVVAFARIWRNLARNDLAAAVLREAPWEGATADELLLLRSEEVLSGHDGASYDVIARQAAEVLAQAEVCEADRIVFHLRVVLAALALIEGEPLRALAHRDAADLLGARFGQDLAIPLAEARVIRAAAVLDLGQQDRMERANLAPLASAARAGPVHLRLATTAGRWSRAWSASSAVRHGRRRSWRPEHHGTTAPTSGEQAALKRLYPVVRSLELTGRGRRRWTYRWKPALNAVATTLEGERVDCDGRGRG